MVGISGYHLLEPVHTHTWMQRQKQINLHLPLKSKFHCIIFRAREFFHHHCQILPLPFPIRWNLGCFLMCILQAISSATQKFWLIGSFIVYWTQGDHSYSTKLVKDLLTDMGSTASCLILCEITVVHKTWPLNWSQDIQSCCFSFFFFFHNFSLVCLNIVENDI